MARWSRWFAASVATLGMLALTAPAWAQQHSSGSAPSPTKGGVGSTTGSAQSNGSGTQKKTDPPPPPAGLTPEVPWAAALPLVAGAAGLTIWARNRRQAREEASSFSSMSTQ
jgi:hypothetical protein